MTEEVVTRFTADISDLTAQIAEAGAKLKKYEDFADGAAASGNQLSSNLGSLTAKTMALEGVQRKVIAAEKDHATSLSASAKAARDLASAQDKVGNTKGFEAAGAAATEEGKRIDALIQKIQQLRAAHAAAGASGTKAGALAQTQIEPLFNSSQQQLRETPIPQGANTADVTAALEPLRAIQQQAPLAAAAVDKAAADINADLASIGTGAPQAFNDLEKQVGQVTNKVGDFTAAERKAVTEAGAILSEYRDIVNTGEKFPGQLEELKSKAAAALPAISAIADEEERAQRAMRARAIIDNKDLTQAQQQEAAAVAGVTKEYEALAAAAKRTNDGAKAGSRDQIGLLTQLQSRIDLLNQKKLSLTDPKKIAQTNAELRKLNAEFSKLANAQPPSGGIKGFFSQLGGAGQGLIGQATSGLGGLGSLFSSLTGPIGIAAGAVAAFFANFTRLDAVKVGLEALKIQMGFIGDRLANLDFKGVFDPSTQRKDAIIAATVATGLDIIQDKQLGVNKANADAEVQLAGLNQKLRDRTRSDEDRLAIASEISTLEAARIKEEIKLIEQRIFVQNILNKKQQSERDGLGEVSDANKAALNELEVARANASARSIQLTETVERRRNGIIQEGETDRQRIAQKGEEARKRAAEQAIKDEQQRAEAAKSVNEIVIGLQNDELRSGLKARDQQAFDIDQKYDAMVAKAQAAFAIMRKLAGEGTPGSDEEVIKSIKIQETTVTTQINTGRDREQKTTTDANNAAEIQKRADFNEQVEDLIASSDATQLDMLRSRIDAGESLIGDDRARYFELIERTNEAEIKAAQDKYAKLLEDNAKFNSDANGLTVEGKTQEAALIAQKDAEILAANSAAQAARNAETFAKMQENVAILSAAADQGIQVLANAAASGEANGKEVAKQLIILLLDTLEKIILMNTAAAATGAIAGNAAAGPAGVTKGIIEAALVTVLIKGMFAAVKAAIGASFEGEPYVTGKQTWPGRDGHLRRVHEGERIVRAKTNAKHYDLFQAAEDGTLKDYLKAQYVMPAINRYLDSDDGRRVSTSIMPAPFADANIVKGLKGNKEAQERTNELLYALLKKEPKVIHASRRSWN